MLDDDHLYAGNCSSLYDLGMGIGKLALQAYVQYTNLTKVVGIELAYSRYILGEKAALTLVSEWPNEYELISHTPNQSILISSIENKKSEKRTLEFRRGNLFAATDCHNADIVIAQTNFPSETQIKLCRFLGCMKPSCKILTYLNLIPLWKRAVSKNSKAKESEHRVMEALQLRFLCLLPLSNLFHCHCHVSPLFQNTQTSLF